MHRLLIPLLRILSDGKFHAGSVLALRMDVSRATVCNVLKSADEMNIKVFKVQGRGYQLPVAPDWLDAEAVGLGLQGDARLFRVEVVDDVDSTNTVLLRAAEPAPHRHCLAAEYQHAGRGRRGRTWLAALGGSLTCSVRWRFSQGIGALSGLSLAVGVALLRSLHDCGATHVQLKWPNDVLWQGRKLAGILIEVQGEANGPSVAVIGIGINVHIAQETRQRITQPVTDIFEILGHSVSRNILLAQLLNHLEKVMAEFELHGLTRLRDEWQAAHAHAGQWLQVTMANGSCLNGRALGLTPLGALLLENESGAQLAVHSGDVQLARQAG